MDDINANSTNRIRWAMMPTIVEESFFEDEDDTLPSLNATPKYCIPKMHRKLEDRVIVFKRLLKPMYYNAVRMAAQVEPIDTITRRNYIQCPIADTKIFVDVDDRTLWIAASDPMDIDDFYKSIVTDGIATSKYDGYDVDKNPSTNLVPLAELKETLVEWWCR